jgi:hypothetical protein
MRTTWLKRSAVSVFAALSLAVSSFAAPLCACLDTKAKPHACCEKMEGHCPMKSHAANSLDKARHAGCACFAEKQENTPAKISETGKTLHEIPALTAGYFPAVLTIRPEVEKTLFTAPVFTENLFSIQTPARAPPACEIKHN